MDKTIPNLQKQSEALECLRLRRKNVKAARRILKAKPKSEMTDTKIVRTNQLLASLDTAIHNKTNAILDLELAAMKTKPWH